MSDSMVGRERTVLVSQGDREPVGVMSHIIAKARYGSGQHVTYSGSAEFEPSVREHIGSVLLPLVNRVLSLMAQESMNFELSAANVGAASVRNSITSVSGFSADVPIVTAMLSSALGIETNESVVCTGHISSSGGDLSVVRNIPAKMLAAAAVPDVETFLFPWPDQSVDALAPDERQRIEDTLYHVRSKMCVKMITNLCQVLENVFTEESIVIASLKKGFFEVVISDNKGDHIQDAAAFLASNIEKRFWDAVESSLFEKDAEKARSLLERFAQYHLQREIYPHGIGKKLLGLMQSIPRQHLASLSGEEILLTGTCIALSQFATDSDHNDVQFLFQASRPSPAAIEPIIRNAETNFDAIMEATSEETLAREIGEPIDNARLSFTLGHGQVRTLEEFVDVISRLYLYLLWHTCPEPPERDFATASDEAIQLVQDAYAPDGGFKAALSDARKGRNAGLRGVLDRMTEHYKNERYANRVTRILKTAINQLNDNELIEFTKRILEWLKPFLPEEVQNERPEFYASHYEDLAFLFFKARREVSHCFNRF